jgi:porin
MSALFRGSVHWGLLGSLLLAGTIVHAAAEPAVETFNANISPIGHGTSDLTSQLALDAAPKLPLLETLAIDRAFKGWYDRKSSLRSQHGFQFTLAYSALGQFANETRPGNTDHAAGGVFDFAGTWAGFKRGGKWQGMLGFRIADQHRLGTKIAPAAFGDAVGSAWGTSLAFDDISLTVIEGWWEQRLGAKTALRFGKLDASGIFDPSALGNPFEHFMGQPFNLNNSIPFPAEGLGILANFEPRRDISILVGVLDGNGNGTDWNFDEFFRGDEHLKLAELAWFPNAKYGRGEYHVTAWHSDEKDNGKTPSGSGYTFYTEQRFGNIAPFIRYGHSRGGAAALRNMVAAGLGFYKPFGRSSDGIGVGITWGEPFGERVREQFGVEAYYRIQLTREIAVTPDIQYIVNPSRNLSEDSIVILSLRVRANL